MNIKIGTQIFTLKKILPCSYFEELKYKHPLKTEFILEDVDVKTFGDVINFLETGCNLTSEVKKKLNDYKINYKNIFCYKIPYIKTESNNNISEIIKIIDKYKKDINPLDLLLYFSEKISIQANYNTYTESYGDYDFYNFYDFVNIQSKNLLLNMHIMNKINEVEFIYLLNYYGYKFFETLYSSHEYYDLIKSKMDFTDINTDSTQNCKLKYIYETNKYKDHNKLCEVLLFAINHQSCHDDIDNENLVHHIDMSIVYTVGKIKYAYSPKYLFCKYIILDEFLNYVPLKTNELYINHKIIEQYDVTQHVKKNNYLTVKNIMTIGSTFTIYEEIKNLFIYGDGSVIEISYLLKQWNWKDSE